jgi:cell division septation protein DedD
MSPQHRQEKTYDMDAREPQDSELEQELDHLYQKVANLDQPEDKQNRTAMQSDGETPAATDTQKPAEIRSVQKKRGRFHTSRIGWGFAFTLLVLGTIGFFYWPGAYDYGTFHFKGIAYPLKTHRLTGETRYYNGKEWLRPPIDIGIVARTAEESKDQAVTTPPAEEPENQAITPPPIGKNGQILEAPPAADTPPEGRRKRYAIQLRAYPEDRKQNATAFLEDMRKRTPDVSMETVSIAERGVWHRILLGNFSTRKEAADYQKSDLLTREYPESFIQRKIKSGP